MVWYRPISHKGSSRNFRLNKGVDSDAAYALAI